mmetsp:Transcript_19049/g.57552  ORF Transcript_19049/g.57552 Transcript_19049/m.57552 type:complete len:219 (+) Transcript_19049:2007-2663(+)
MTLLYKQHGTVHHDRAHSQPKQVSEGRERAPWSGSIRLRRAGRLQPGQIGRCRALSVPPLRMPFTVRRGANCGVGYWPLSFRWHAAADERRRCVELELNGNWDVSVHPPHRAREGVANERARRLVAWRSQLKHSTDVRVACHTCVASSDAQLDLSRRGGGGGEEEGDGARLPPERDEQRGRNPFRELCGERLLGGGTQGAVEGGRRLGLAWAGGGDGE